MGMAAGEGAIEQVRSIRNQGPDFKLIGSGPLRNLRVGLIDLVAEMFLADLIDIQGKFKPQRPH